MSRRGHRAGPRPLVLSLSLGTGSLAVRGAMGLEPETRTGASGRTSTAAPDRVRSCHCVAAEQDATRPTSVAPASGYAPPATATSWKAGRFSGQDFPLH